MALSRDKMTFAGGLDIVDPTADQIVDSQVAATFAVVGITSAVMSSVGLTYNCTTATAGQTNVMLGRVIEELIRKGILNGTFNT